MLTTNNVPYHANAVMIPRVGLWLKTANSNSAAATVLAIAGIDASPAYAIGWDVDLRDVIAWNKFVG